MYSLSRYSCTFPPSELTRCVCRSFHVDAVNAAVVGNQYLWQDHLSLVCLCRTPGNWKTPSTEPSGSIRRVQIAVLLHFWVKLICREGWTLKVLQPVPRSCTCAWHQSEKKKKEFHNSQADFISLRFATCISWEVIKDNCRHLWWSHITFVFKSFTEKPVSYTMQGITLGRNLCPFYLNLTPLEVEQGFSFVASRVFSSVFGEVGWFQQGQVV